MPSNPVVWFEIPVRDLARAIAFYEQVLGLPLTRADIDGNAMALFPSVDGGPGAAGALACGDSYVPGRSGPRVYFGVDDIDAVVARALATGGEACYPVTEVPGTGWVAEVIDCEGNCIALFADSRVDRRTG